MVTSPQRNAYSVEEEKPVVYSDEQTIVWRKDNEINIYYIDEEEECPQEE